MRRVGLCLGLGLICAALAWGPSYGQESYGQDSLEPVETDDTARPFLAIIPQPKKPEKPAALPLRPLRILLAYTPKALTDVPDIHAAAALVISQINMTLANSNIALTAELAGLDRVDYAETPTEDSTTMLNAATFGTGDFARIATLRQVVKADLVMVMAHWTYEGNCGRGWQLDTLDNGTTSPNDAVQFGYSVISTDGGNCAFARSAPHEIGHNLGAAHDRFVTPDAKAGPAGYNYGYVDPVARVRDMMAYSNECVSQGLRCVRLFIYADPDIIHNGRPLGVPVSSPKAAAAARRIREIAPYVTQFRDVLRPPPSNVLAVLTSGEGTVAGGGIDCGPKCSTAVAANTAVTLTAKAVPGWRLAGWSGACTGAGPCTVTMNASRTVSATFVPSLRLGPVVSSASTGGAQSLLRFANTGTAAGRVAVNITNPVTGADLGRWTSAAVAPGAALEVPIATVERAIVPGTPLPATYAVAVEPEFAGAVQHVLKRGAALTNLSTCDAGVTADPGRVNYAQSGVSSIVVAQAVRGNESVNAGSHDTVNVTLGLFDARDGARLGAYVTPAIPRNGQAVIAVADMERAAGITPNPARAYDVVVESAFSGYLQHLVTSDGVIADMTTACAFAAPAPAFDTAAMIQPGPVFASSAGGQSYLRFFNTGTAAGTVNVTLASTASGTALGQWTSPAIAPGASRQFALSEIEAAVPTRASTYTALVQTQIPGFMQHVLWRADGTLSNASTCDVGVVANPTQIANVHAPLIAGYASSVVLTNTGAAAMSATLGLYDAATGARRGGYATAAIPAGGQLTPSVAVMEAALNTLPGGTLHYVVKVENGFTGFLQHLVANAATGVTTDLTAACALPAPSVRYELCSPDAPCALSANATGQLKAQYLTDNYRVTLAAGRPATIEIKARDSAAGTLFAPRLMILNAAGAQLANVTTGGTGRDVRYVFTPPAGGVYTIVVSARESGYSNEDDFQVINPTMGTYRISVTN